jgi:hypothetical protein
MSCIFIVFEHQCKISDYMFEMFADLLWKKVEQNSSFRSGPCIGASFGYVYIIVPH